MKIAKTIYYILSYPFQKEPFLFAALMGATCINVVTSMYYGLLGASAFISNTVISYLLTVFVSCIGFFKSLKFLALLCRVLIITYSCIMALLSFWGCIFIETPKALNSLLLILQTNLQETKEFFSCFVDIRVIIYTVSTIFLASFITYCTYRLLSYGILRIQRYTRMVLTAICWLAISSFSVLPKSVLLSSPQLEFMTTNLEIIFNHHDLRHYICMPQLSEVRNTHPKNVVLILGESHCRSHSSLLGYDKQTNPMLQQLVDSHNLVAFDSITSGAAYTGSSILRIMSTYPVEQNDWWKCQTLPTTMKTIGYTTYWLTNQRGGATRDAIADSYGKLCDYFQRTAHNNAYDEDLIPLIKNIEINNDSGRKFIVCHLMGSHEEFGQRFPSEFRKFQAKDYPSLPFQQRQTVADYDNSLLYNDYIITSIINHFSMQSSIIIYIPDHALDLYMTDPNYARHAKDSYASQQAASKIPMFIYLSDAYKKLDNTAYYRLVSNRHKQINTENIIYTIVNLSGYRYIHY